MAMSTDEIRIVLLPHVSPDGTGDAELEKISINQLRDFRLASLQADPDAFGSSYAVESQKPFSFWRSRLSGSKATHFVAVRGADDWIGMIVLLGPQDMDPTEVVSAKGSPWPMFTSSRASQETTSSTVQDTWDVASYHISGTFTLPSARGLGVAKSVLKEALRHAAAESQRLGKRQVRCTLTVDQVNEAATKLYESVGFYHVGEEWYTPLPRESGPQYDKLAIHYELRATLG